MKDGNELNELYRPLAPELCDELSRHEEQITVPAGTKLIGQGTMPEHLIFIHRGSVEISVPAGGKIISLSVVGNGRVLGLRPIVSDTASEIEATAVDESTIGRIPRNIFLEVLKQHPEMYFAISKILSTDLNSAERLLRDLPRSASKERQRVADTF